MSFSRWPAPGILALYHLEDVNDSSGNSHTLTNNGTVTFGLGKFSDCALFGDANNSKYLSHADGLGEDLSGGASISIWFLIQTHPTSGQLQTIARWGSTTGTSRYIGIYYINDAGTKKLRITCSASSTANIDYTIDLTTGVWYKLDVNIAATCEAFLNGKSIGTVSMGTTTTSYDNISMGVYLTSPPIDYLKGNVDEAVFFSAVRSAADIRRRYAFERGMLV